jgi:Ni/Co efflux regulator RcnB
MRLWRRIVVLVVMASVMAFMSAPAAWAGGYDDKDHGNKDDDDKDRCKKDDDDYDNDGKKDHEDDDKDKKHYS